MKKIEQLKQESQESIESGLDNTPVKPTINEIKTINDEWVKSIEGNPNKLLRILPIDAKTPAQLQESIEILKRGSQLFANLIKHYGIHIPDTDMKVEQDSDGMTKSLTLVDRIYGTNIAEASELPSEAKEELDAFYSALAKHYLDVFKTGGDFWFDFRNDQLLYGHKYKENQNFIYLVDLDPEYQIYDKIQKKQGKRLLRLMARIYESVQEVEKKLPLGTRLEKTRRVLQVAISQIPEDEPYYDLFIGQLKKKLEKNNVCNGILSIYFLIALNHVKFKF